MRPITAYDALLFSYLIIFLLSALRWAWLNKKEIDSWFKR